MDSGLQPILSICGYAEQLTLKLRTSSDKNPNDVYVGTVVLPGSRERAHAYVKIFPPADRLQLVYNEVIAHHLALQCDLPSPLTFPCACPVALLRSGSRAVMVPHTGDAFVLGVASFDGAVKDARQTLIGSDAKAADILNWPHVARLAVFDELLGNDDRHLENLVRRGPHDYILIDNERILFGQQWFGADLEKFRAKSCDANILADTIGETTDEVMRQRMISIAQYFVSGTLLIVPEISDRLERLCSAPADTTERLIAMLNARRTLLRTLMHYHLTKGDLFQARTNR